MRFLNDSISSSLSVFYSAVTVTIALKRSPDFHTAEVVNTKSRRLLTAPAVEFHCRSSDK